jgi:hypothetical protein
MILHHIDLQIGQPTFGGPVRVDLAGPAEVPHRIPSSTSAQDAGEVSVRPCI